MRESRVITDVWFEPSQGFDVRDSLTFSDATKVRLDPEDFKLKLKLDSDSRYPLDANISVRTRTFRPNALRQLLIVEVLSELPEGTSVGLRLYDGTSERYWNGATWAVAGPGNWNTEAVLNAHVSTFPVTSRVFAVVFNLVTTDDYVTPIVSGARVLWRGPIDWVDDLLVDSLVGSLQAMTYVEDLALPPTVALSTTIDLDSYEHENPLSIADLDAVFDEDDDPTHSTNLLSGYNPTTRVITLTVGIPIGNRPFIRAIVTPSVSWETSQDYERLGSLPSIVLRDTRSVRSAPYSFRSANSIVRRDTLAAVETPAPYRMTYEIELEVSVDRTTTQMRLLEELMRFFQDGPSGEVGPFLRSVATDRRYRLHLIEEFRASDPRLNLSDVRTFAATFRLMDAALDIRAARDHYAVGSLKLGFTAIPSEGEAEAVADGAPVPSSPIETIVVD